MSSIFLSRPPFYLVPSEYKVKFNLKDRNILNQVVHPDIIKFNNNFRIETRPYKYIMVMTPYPHYNEMYENPCIVVSNSGIEFVEDLIPNPIEPCPGKGYHNSDPEIVYTKGYFYVFWRLRQTSTNVARLFVKKSKNLINWSDKQMIHILPVPLSPAIIYDIHENRWKMWGIEEGNWRVVYYESDDGLHWEFINYTNMPGYINWLGSKRNCWHLDVNKTKVEKRYFALIVYASGSGGAPPTFLFLGESEDGISWKVYGEPVLSPLPHSWQSSKIYRSTFIIEEGKIKVWYSASSQGIFLRKLGIKVLGRKIGVGKWGIGYTECDLSSYIGKKDATLNVVL